MMLSYGFAVVSKENMGNAAPMPHPNNQQQQQQTSQKQTNHAGDKPAKFGAAWLVRGAGEACLWK